VNAYEAILAALDSPTPLPDTTPPSVSITSPADVVTVSGTINVDVSAADDVGITQVELYLNGALFATDTTEPFSFAWDTTQSSNGTHTLQAMAYDAVGNTGTSATVSVSVDNSVPNDTTPPSVSITSPANGATVSKVVKIKVSASDNGQVQQVEVYVDGSLIGSADCTASSCSPTLNWNTNPKGVTDGTYILQAIAYDAVGNTGTSATVSVTVNKSGSTDPTLPSASITSPADGATVSGTISVDVSAADDVGVTQVNLYLDGALLATDTTESFSFTWDTTQSSNGTHTLQAVAYDAAGNSGTSATVSVTVNNTVSDDTIPPTVTLISPANGDIVSKVVRIEVSASDNGQVQQVEVYVDGSLIGLADCAASSCSSTLNWNTNKRGVTGGVHTLWANAYDAAGNLGTSNLVTVTVDK